MENTSSKTISEVIELLGKFDDSNFMTISNIKNNVTDEVKIENIIEYLDKSKEIVSKFRDFDLDGDDSKMLKRFWRKLLGHILKGIGNFLIWLGDKLINEEPK